MQAKNAHMLRASLAAMGTISKQKAKPVGFRACSLACHLKLDEPHQLF